MFTGSFEVVSIALGAQLYVGGVEFSERALSLFFIFFPHARSIPYAIHFSLLRHSDRKSMKEKDHRTRKENRTQRAMVHDNHGDGILQGVLLKCFTVRLA